MIKVICDFCNVDGLDYSDGLSITSNTSNDCYILNLCEACQKETKQMLDTLSKAIWTRKNTQESVLGNKV